MAVVFAKVQVWPNGSEVAFNGIEHAPGMVLLMLLLLPLLVLVVLVAAC